MANGSKVFTVMVVGDNPDELMQKYDSNATVEKYVKYKYLDAEKMRTNSIKLLEEILKDPKKFNFNIYHIDSLRERIKNIKSMSTFEYYSELTSGLYIDANGDAWCDENPDGKWQTYKLGNYFSLPLILNDGTETHSALNKDIDWFKMHMQNTHTYDVVWDLVNGVKEPETDEEKTLYENMKDNVNYFSKFKNKDEYVVHNCAYWNYAYLDKNGWKDIDDSKNDIEWVSQYFDTFCANLKEGDKVTIFECTKDKID